MLPVTSRVRVAALSLALLVGIAGLGVQRGLIDPMPLFRPAPPGGNVVFIVLDAVRADHLGLCGYGRPTSPTLQRLVDAGASLSCRAYAPGSWTLPSHASYFTGVDVPTHGAHSVDDPSAEVLGLNTIERVRPLGPDLPTLAEQLGAAGYSTVSVSGNPVVSEVSGLTRGFDHVRSARVFGQYAGDDLVLQVSRALAFDADADSPLFLFVNIADAHVPWEGIPSGVGWVEPRPALDWRSGTHWADFMLGRMTGDPRLSFLGWLTDVYDYGVYRADHTLDGVLDTLERYGRLTPDSRVVVTSDHGEFLGEHDLIDHGHYLYEPNNRVFLLDSRGEALPEPVSALAVYDLVLTGHLRDPLPEIAAAAYPHVERRSWTEGRWFDQTSAARWTGDDEELWSSTLGWQAGSPDHLVPVEGPTSDLLERYVERTVASGISTGEVDPALQERLELLGYMGSGPR